jgi:NAD(P)-dependent dehydrogenase (short-subunit alcohol dehydrogenase family)
VSAPIGPLLDGRVAIVTGGGAGIGRGISEAFVAHGAHVVVVDSDPARASTVEGAYGIHADVREPGAAERIAAETVDVFGPADVLVNNVGMYLMGGKRFWDTTEADWQAMYDVNLLHVFRMSRAVLGSMVERRRGSIITVSTVEAFRGIPGQPIYGAFKAGVAHFTKCLAVDVAGEGVRVNDIAPDVTGFLRGFRSVASGFRAITLVSQCSWRATCRSSLRAPRFPSTAAPSLRAAGTRRPTEIPAGPTAPSTPDHGVATIRFVDETPFHRYRCSSDVRTRRLFL